MICHQESGVYRITHNYFQLSASGLDYVLLHRNDLWQRLVACSGCEIDDIIEQSLCTSTAEHAFELWLDYAASPYFQRNLPKRMVWLFPLYVGREWLVSESRVPPEITYTRKVVSDKGVLTVPAGTFKDVYYIEEYVYITDFSSGEESPDKYWVAPDVGIIKYEYMDFISNTTRTYELTEFTKGR